MSITDPINLWLTGEMEVDGFPVWIHVRSVVPEEHDRELFQHLVIIRWSYTGDRDELPDEKERERMTAFEKAVEPLMGQTKAGVLAASLTGRGNQEWRYYTSNPEGFMVQLNRALGEHARYPLEFELFQDPDWNALAELLPNLNHGDSIEKIVRH
ncbi:MAG: DUF695 domain-containing protein [Xanthomonadaceae bacterium]|jgi:hypothetical protein|nr:DUF695 domain-containing protein [Xanthomonadaceae bacterium]